jgi:tRNA (adenine37-N6)-methyltransferase
MDTDFIFHPIGIVHSCFTEKFGIPRQPGLVPAARATLEILPPYDRNEAFRGLNDFSHLWILFVFHGIGNRNWQPTVRPPRLGGNTRVGVFATRSGFRPNPIGMSSVVLEGVRRDHGKLVLELSGVDVMDQTPVLDIKPYLPYADIIPHAVGGFASAAPRSSLSIDFTARARQACSMLENTYPGFCDLVSQVLKADPRPAYVGKHSGKSEFGLRLYDVNVRWTVRQNTIVVHTIDAHPDEPKRQ